MELWNIFFFKLSNLQKEHFIIFIMKQNEWRKSIYKNIDISFCLIIFHIFWNWEKLNHLHLLCGLLIKHKNIKIPQLIELWDTEHSTFSLKQIISSPVWDSWKVWETELSKRSVFTSSVIQWD